MDWFKAFLGVPIRFPTPVVSANSYAELHKLLQSTNRHSNANFQHYPLSPDDDCMYRHPAYHLFNHECFPKRWWKSWTCKISQKIWCIEWWFSLWQFDFKKLEPSHTYPMANSLHHLSELKGLLLLLDSVEHSPLNSLSLINYSWETKWLRVQ